MDTSNVRLSTQRLLLTIEINREKDPVRKKALIEQLQALKQAKP